MKSKSGKTVSESLGKDTVALMPQVRAFCATVLVSILLFEPLGLRTVQCEWNGVLQWLFDPTEILAAASAIHYMPLNMLL